MKLKPEDSYIREIMECPYSEDKRRRAERRWKRKELILNEDLKPNNPSSARRITVKSCGNMPSLTDNNSRMAEDDVDEDYKMFLDTYGSHVVVENNDSFNNDADTVCSSDNDDSDPQYKMFLENLRKEGNSYIAKLIVNDQLVYISYEGEEEEETSDLVGSQPSPMTERGPFNKSPVPYVSGVPKNNCNTELELDNVDEDYQKFLNCCRIDDKGFMYVEVGSELQERSSSARNNSQVSNQAFDTPEVQCDIGEKEQTGDLGESQQSLENEKGPFNKRPGPDVSRVPKNNRNIESNIDNVDEDYQKFLNCCRFDEGLIVEVGSEFKGRSSSIRNYSQVSNRALDTPEAQCENDQGQESQQSLESNIELEVDSVDEDYQTFLNCYMIDDDGLGFVKVESDLKGKSSSVRYNSQVSDQAFGTPKFRCDIIEDKQLLTNPSRINDGNLVHMRDMDITKTYKGITETYKGDGCSNSSEPDVVILERDQIDENTPFIFSRIYDSSCFQNEKKPRDNDCEFRRRLMEDLSRPYDQEEWKKLLHEVQLKLPKERHAETRQGVVSRYRTHGFNKSYLELYPDLAQAIAEFNEPHKVLFLLRGFFFWLQNSPHDGKVKPWTDKLCLEHLQKM